MTRLHVLPLLLLAACAAEEAQPDAGVDSSAYIGWWSITYDRGDCGADEIVDVRIVEAAEGGVETDWGSDATVATDPGGVPLRIEYVGDSERLNLVLTPYDTSAVPVGDAAARVRWEGDYLGEHCAMRDYVDASDVTISPL